MRLSAETLGTLPASVARPAYDVAAQTVGIVHFGIGAFHRAHMAWYTDRAMAAGERDWRIMGVSLRSASVAEQMNPQDGLYTVSERSRRRHGCVRRRFSRGRAGRGYAAGGSRRRHRRADHPYR